MKYKAKGSAKSSDSHGKWCKYNGPKGQPAMPKHGHRPAASKAKIVGHHRP